MTEFEFRDLRIVPGCKIKVRDNFKLANLRGKVLKVLEAKEFTLIVDYQGALVYPLGFPMFYDEVEFYSEGEVEE